MATFNHFNSENMYKCKCGKKFESSQSFNAHKGHCKVHLGEDKYNKRLEQQIVNMRKGNQAQMAVAKIKRELILEQWVSEKHICEKCEKVMTEKFGSGRFCSRACANSRDKSNVAKTRIRVTKIPRIYVCENCGKEFYKQKGSGKFCCKECSSAYHSKKRYEEYLKDNSITWGQQHMRNYKKYFLEEQNHCCAICGMKDEWNGKQLVFVLDHIDGNADNNNRDNLRLICPNCDSQLDTFKSKNKHSARAKYRNIKIVEKS